jgi:hypothetical protein
MVTLGLDALFSVLLELNQREPDLCLRALQARKIIICPYFKDLKIQALLQTLQELAPGSLGEQRRPLVHRLFAVLVELRAEGSGTDIGSTVIACLLALATAHGRLELVLALVRELLCDGSKRGHQNGQVFFFFFGQKH